MKLTIDFETRSSISLKKAGAFRYAEDPTTEVLCLALKVEDEPPYVIACKHFQDILSQQPSLTESLGKALIKKPLEECAKYINKLIDKVDIIEAHNVQFEQAVWSKKMVPMGYNELPFEKIRCSAAKAAYHALPRSLGEVTHLLNLDQVKDKAGHALMMSMCKPRKPRKAERTKNPDWQNTLYWKEEPLHVRDLLKYCMQDVNSEHSLSSALRDLSEDELRVWRIDNKANAKGITCDVESCLEFTKVLDKSKEDLDNELYELTKGKVSSAKQAVALKDYLCSIGCDIPNVTAETVDKMLNKKAGLNPTQRRILEIRKSTSKSSTAKFTTMLTHACADGRLKGMLRYHGASTGRWTGVGVQPQNYPRNTVDDVESVVADLQFGLFETGYSNKEEVASSCLRGMLTASQGYDLVCADYSAIEGRVLAWLVGEDEILDNYRKGLDAYKCAASMLFRIPYEEVDKEQRSKGKVSELACGYQMSGRRLIEYSAPMGVKLTTNEANDIVTLWRGNRPKTVSFWTSINKAALKAVKNKGQVIDCLGLKLKASDYFLYIRLLSGRVLHYYRPHIKKNDYGSDSVFYFGIDSTNPGSRRFTEVGTYGGKLTNNIVQAMSRDIMVNGMFNIEDSKLYEILLTVHDEVIAEVPEGLGNLEEFESLMCDLPEWAEGLPVKAEGWIGKRYRK